MLQVVDIPESIGGPAFIVTKAAVIPGHFAGRYQSVGGKVLPVHKVVIGPADGTLGHGCQQRPVVQMLDNIGFAGQQRAALGIGAQSFDRPADGVSAQ